MIRVTVAGLGARTLTASVAEDYGIRPGETIGQQIWMLAAKAEHDRRRA